MSHVIAAHDCTIRNGESHIQFGQLKRTKILRTRVALIQYGNFMLEKNVLRPLQLLQLPTHVQHNVVLLAFATFGRRICHGQLQIYHLTM